MKRIFSWNVSGIRAVDRKGFRKWLKKADPDILGIQEISADIEQIDYELRNIENYNSYFYTAKKSGYSGVGIYTKSKPLSVEPLGDGAFDREGRIMIAKYSNFTLINCYFPNSQMDQNRIDFKMAFCDAIHDKCNEFVKNGENVLLIGDYNIMHKYIDIANPELNQHMPGFFPKERAWMTKFLDSGYVDTFRYFYPEKIGQYTWWSHQFQARSKNLGQRLDYACVNKDFLSSVTNVKIHQGVLGSDHCPISIDLDVE